MQEWFIDNWLALFGALTGTIALLIHYLSYRHSRNKDEIDLAVSVAPHAKREENIRRLSETANSKEWERPNMVEVYTVTVTNRGNISAPLSQVGVVLETGLERLAHVDDERYLQQATSKNIKPLPGKSHESFSVYLRRDEEPFHVLKAFVVDQTGKRWEANA